MKTSLSPTTVLGYVRCLTAIAIVGKPLYDFYTVANWDAVKETIAATAALALVNGVLSAVQGHFQMDAPTVPKPDVQTTINP